MAWRTEWESGLAWFFLYFSHYCIEVSTSKKERALQGEGGAVDTAITIGKATGM